MNRAGELLHLKEERRNWVGSHYVVKKFGKEKRYDFSGKCLYIACAIDSLLFEFSLYLTGSVTLGIPDHLKSCYGAVQFR